MASMIWVLPAGLIIMILCLCLMILLDKFIEEIRRMIGRKKVHKQLDKKIEEMKQTNEEIKKELHKKC